MFNISMPFKAFLFGLVLTPLVFASLPARAGSWTISYSASGTNDGSTSSNFGPNGTPTSYTFPTQNWGSSPGGMFSIHFADGASATLKSTGTITAKLTWVPNPNLPSDPAPPSVLLQETASAQ